MIVLYLFLLHLREVFFRNGEGPLLPFLIFFEFFGGNDEKSLFFFCVFPFVWQKKTRGGTEGFMTTGGLFTGRETEGISQALYSLESPEN